MSLLYFFISYQVPTLQSLSISIMFLHLGIMTTCFTCLQHDPSALQILLLPCCFLAAILCQIQDSSKEAAGKH